MTPKPKILVVDDEVSIRKMLKAAVPESDFDFLEAGSGREGISAIATQNPEVVIFDLGLPDMDGVECIKEIRQWSQVPIIVLTAREQDQSKIDALDAGANDYVTKPFSVGELLARIRVALRNRSRSNVANVFEAAGLKVDLVAHLVSVNGSEIHLTPLEYKLLTLLTSHPDRVLTHRQIISHVWGAAYAGETHYLRILMKSLRHKVERDPTRPELLITEMGVGYRLKTSL